MNEGGQIIRTVLGTSHKEAETISLRATKENLEFTSPEEVRFHGKDGGKKFGDFKKKKEDKPLKVTKVEGPFDENGKKVDVIKKGEYYTYKATPSFQPSKAEVKQLKWAIKYDNGTIKEFAGFSAYNKLIEGKICVNIRINQDFEEAKVYAYFIKASEKVSVEVNIGNQLYRFNPSSYMAGKYSKSLNNFYVIRENWKANPPILDQNHSFEPYVLVQNTKEKYIQDKQAIPTLTDSLFGIALHHSGNSGIKTMTEVQNEHVNGKNKFADVGYHFGIDLSGVVYEGRYIGVKGSHLTKYNTGVVGIVFLADFDHDYFWDTNGDDKMSSEAMVAIVTLINSLKEQYPNIAVLGGHNEWKNNVGERRCPGEYGMTFVKALRNTLKMKSPKEAGHG